MSQNACRGPRYVELFSTNNQLLLNKWKMHTSVKKVFDDQLKSFVYVLKRKSPVPLMHWPKEKINVDLSHPILVFQIYFEIGASILIDIGITCSNNLRKRITLSGNQKSQRIDLLSTVLPLSLKNLEKWSHLLIDVEDVVSSTWKKEEFGTIDSLRIGGVCNVKRIFTLRKDMLHTEEGMWTIKYDQMPKHLQLTRNVPQTYYFVPCSNDAKREDTEFLKSCYTHQRVSSTSSSYSGYSKDLENTYKWGQASSKSAQSLRNTSQTSVSNVKKSDVNFQTIPSEKYATKETYIDDICANSTSKTQTFSNTVEDRTDYSEFNYGKLESNSDAENDLWNFTSLCDANIMKDEILGKKD